MWIRYSCIRCCWTFSWVLKPFTTKYMYVPWSIYYLIRVYSPNLSFDCRENEIWDMDLRRFEHVWWTSLLIYYILEFPSVRLSVSVRLVLKNCSVDSSVWCRKFRDGPSTDNKLYCSCLNTVNCFNLAQLKF